MLLQTKSPHILNNIINTLLAKDVIVFIFNLELIK